MGDPWCSHDAMGYHRAGFDVVGVDGAGRVRGWGRLGQSDRWWIFLAAMLALTTGATAGYALLRPRSVVSTVALPPVTSFPPVPQDVVLPPPARALVRPAVFPVPATTRGPVLVRPVIVTTVPAAGRSRVAGASSGPAPSGAGRVSPPPAQGSPPARATPSSAHCPPSVPHSPAQPPGESPATQRAPGGHERASGQHNAAAPATTAATTAAAQRASGDHPSRRPAATTAPTTPAPAITPAPAQT